MIKNQKEKGALVLLFKEVESIIINPVKFYKAIEIHFENYLKKLKSGEDQSIVDAFKKAVDLKWGLDIEYVNFGMTEEEFKNNKY